LRSPARFGEVKQVDGSILGGLLAGLVEDQKLAIAAYHFGLEDRAFAERLRAYLDIMTYPIRVGTHFNTSFAMILSLEWANQFHDELAVQICERTLHWFGADRDCQAWEPGGDEFLSPALTEAL